MNIDEEIDIATQFANQGNNRKAREILRNVLAIDNKNESAWLLFSKVAEKQSHEILCINNVLKINPNNEYAINRLRNIENTKISNKNTNNLLNVSSMQLIKKVALILFAVILVCIVSIFLLFIAFSNNTSAIPNTQQPSATTLPNVIGMWLDNWVVHSTIVIQKINGSYQIKYFYGDGSVETKILKVKVVDGVERLYVYPEIIPGNPSGDYMVILSNGDLGFYDNEGFIYLDHPK